MDTAKGGYQYDRIHDSLRIKQEQDSFHAMKPIATFYSDKAGLAFDKLVAAVIDTTGLTKTPVAFSDTSIITYNKDRTPVYECQILRNQQFVIKLIKTTTTDNITTSHLYINGREQRQGIEIDTSLSNEDHLFRLTFTPNNCQIITLGSNRYLLLNGFIEKCNGRGCGVRYYIVHNPTLHKTIILEQLRSEVVFGRNTHENTLAFLRMTSRLTYDHQFQCFLFSGEAFYLDYHGNTHPYNNNLHQQYGFTAYSKESEDTLLLTNGNLRSTQ
ncbi:hypothetical protein [Filimonas lacunae]|nr:hypothetical protein [Filimonas lacunae]